MSAAHIPAHLCLVAPGAYVSSHCQHPTRHERPHAQVSARRLAAEPWLVEPIYQPQRRPCASPSADGVQLPRFAELVMSTPSCMHANMRQVGIGPYAELLNCCSCRPPSTAAWVIGCAFRVIRVSSSQCCIVAMHEQYRVPWDFLLCCYGAAEALYRSAPSSLCFRCELLTDMRVLKHDW